MPIFAKKIDKNQKEIVDQLRSIPGVSVEVGHDDILVGRNGKTYWLEIKAKKPAPSDLKPSQKRLLKEYHGHYKIVWTLDQILEEIGICRSK